MAAALDQNAIEVFQTVPDDLLASPIADDAQVVAELEGRGPTVRHVQWGTSQPIAPQATNPVTQALSWTTLVLTPVRDVAVDWSIHIQPESIPLLTPSGNGALVVNVRYVLGEASFSRLGVLGSRQPQRFHVTGRSVQVDVAWVNYTAVVRPPAAPIVVHAAAAEGGVADSAMDFYFCQWNLGSTGPGTDISPFAGILAAYQATLLTMTGDAQTYVGFYDSKFANLVSNTTQAIWASPPLTKALQWYSFAEDDDEKLYFNTALCWALSQKPDVYVAPTGFGQACVNVKWGA